MKWKRVEDFCENLPEETTSWMRDDGLRGLLSREGTDVYFSVYLGPGPNGETLSDKSAQAALLSIFPEGVVFSQKRTRKDNKQYDQHDRCFLTLEIEATRMKDKGDEHA